MSTKIKTQVIVLGAGPAGYSAAFRCADLGLETIIVERYDNIGGVCLNVGCIPSKTLLHFSKILKEVNECTKHGITFNNVSIDINKIRNRKNNIVKQLKTGLSNMANTRKINIIHGLGTFIDKNTLIVNNKDEITTINFKNAIIATGSRSIKLSLLPNEDPRIWDSSDALDLKEIPKKLLIIGGGIIGLEMATVYYSLGSTVDILEMSNQLIQCVDTDIMNVFNKNIMNKFNVMFETTIISAEAKDNGIYITMKNSNTTNITKCYDAVLVAIGRAPNSDNCDINKADLIVDKNNFIHTDKQMRTNISHIYAIGDVIGQPMLAHKGIHEGHIAAEVISGLQHFFDPKVIPSIAYTDPEIAWVGHTEKTAKAQGINYEISIFPWTALSRAIASNYTTDGITKLIFDKVTHRVIGGAVIGTNAGELLGEISLAIEMGCDAEDISLTIHAHPTLYESIGLTSKIFEGTITDLPNMKSNLSVKNI